MRLALLTFACALAAPAFGERIRPEHLDYLGAFRAPLEAAGGSSWSYGGTGLAYDAEGDPEGADDGFPGSLYGVGHPHHGFVAEISIPPPRIPGAGGVRSLEVAAHRRPFRDVTGGIQDNRLVGTALGDVEILSPDALAWVVYTYYLPAPDKPTLGFLDPRRWSSSKPSGPWPIATHPSAATSGYLMRIPERFAAAHVPGATLAGGRSRAVNGGSAGPALFAIRAVAPEPAGGSFEATPLLAYSLESPLDGFAYSDHWSDGVWIDLGGRSAVIFVGTKAERDRASGGEYYGEPRRYGCGGKGYHGEPYWAAMLFYDPDELAAVAAGRRAPNEPRPYATAHVENVLVERRCRRPILGGAAFDAQRRVLYVAEVLADGELHRGPILHAWRLAGDHRSPDVTAPDPPRPVSASAGPQGVRLEWSPSVDESAVAYLVSRGDRAVAITVEPRFTDPDPAAEGDDVYEIEARDAVGNRSRALRVVPARGD